MNRAGRWSCGVVVLGILLSGSLPAAPSAVRALGVSGNAALIAIMADRLRELDPGWPANATASRAPGSTPDENNDDEEE